MKKSTTKKWIATLLITLLTVLGLGQTMVHAVEVQGGGHGGSNKHYTDVVITKVETSDEAKPMTLKQLEKGVDVATYFTDGKVLPGVSFTWYSVTDAQLAMMMANPANYDTVAKVDAVVGVGSGTVTAETNADGQVTLRRLPKGNYWVVENMKGTIASARAVPFGLTLPYTNAKGNEYLKRINVYPKNTLNSDEPEIEKTVDKPNVAIGELNTWTVSLDIPEGIEDYKKFSFYDVIDSRLDFEGIDYVIATAGDVSLVKGTDYTVNYVAPRLDVVFTKDGRMKLKEANPKKVNVTLKTRVNKTAIMGQEIPNNATIVFNNGHGVDKEKTPGIPPTVHTGGRAFVKKDSAEDGKVLKGAEFKIKNADGKFVRVERNGSITFGRDGTTFTSDANGKFEVKGLPYGNYVLVETKAPQGYAMPTDPNTPFEVNATSYYANPKAVKMATTPADVIKTIHNRRLVIPQTGGVGTALFTMIGAVTMLLSVIFYRRTNKV